MKICIFGADGRTGVEVVKYAKQKDLEVVAFVYSDALNKFFPNDVIIKKGNVMNYNDVSEAIKGSDAVVSVIGHIKGSDALMQTKGMMNIVKAMEDLGVKRLLSLTGTGAREENDTPSPVDIFLNFFVKLIDPIRINDAVEHVKVLKKSHLDWTVVRVLKLSNNDREVDQYKLSDGGPVELQTSRKKVARILIDLIDDEKFIKKFPIVSG